MEIIYALVFVSFALAAALIGRVMAIRSQERVEMARLSFTRDQEKLEAHEKELRMWRDGVDHQLLRHQNQIDMLKAAHAQKRTVTGLRG